MKIQLSPYRGMNICVALSGGKDSMTLLHVLSEKAEEYKLSVSAMNCEHGLRGEQSKSDSEFVENYCKTHNVPLKRYATDCKELAKTQGVSIETAARNWRRVCYLDAAEYFGAAIATAHHIKDNAETVLFNLARGSGLSGVAGISDGEIKDGDRSCRIIRPLICCTRAEIDNYIVKNGIPFVEDESNFSDAYTRNYIRLNVLPELENAVHGAAENIYRFSRIAAECVEYFDKVIDERGTIKLTDFGFEIGRCYEKPLFKHAVLRCFNTYGIRDYTYGHLERLYALQFAARGKKFQFGGYTAFSEGDKIVFCKNELLKIDKDVCPFMEFYKNQSRVFLGQPLYIEKFEFLGGDEKKLNIFCPKILKFDLDKIPTDAVIRFMNEGDRFTKFGGGTKNLGSYFTDLKIPARMRAHVPVIASGSDVLIVCGVEISEKVKVGGSAATTAVCVASDYVNLAKY